MWISNQTTQHLTHLNTAKFYGHTLLHPTLTHTHTLTTLSHLPIACWATHLICFLVVIVWRIVIFILWTFFLFVFELSCGFFCTFFSRSLSWSNIYFSTQQTYTNSLNDKWDRAPNERTFGGTKKKLNKIRMVSNMTRKYGNLAGPPWTRRC